MVNGFLAEERALACHAQRDREFAQALLIQEARPDHRPEWPAAVADGFGNVGPADSCGPTADPLVSRSLRQSPAGVACDKEEAHD
jgi:hypothetical protein